MSAQPLSDERLAEIREWRDDLGRQTAFAAVGPYSALNDALAEIDRLDGEARAFADRANELEPRVYDCEPVREHRNLRRPAFYQHTATCRVTEMTT